MIAVGDRVSESGSIFTEPRCGVVVEVETRAGPSGLVRVRWDNQPLTPQWVARWKLEVANVVDLIGGLDDERTGDR